jgi:hypothetical protein
MLAKIALAVVAGYASASLPLAASLGVIIIENTGGDARLTWIWRIAAGIWHYKSPRDGCSGVSCKTPAQAKL